MTTTRPSRSRHRSTVRDACGRRRAPAGRVGGAVLVAGSTGTRFAMFQAGTQSVDDPDATVVPREGGRTTSMDGLKLLIADHNRFRGVFARYQVAEEAGEREAMARLVREMDRELTVLTDIEETVFYPWARRLSDDIEATVEEGVE